MATEPKDTAAPPAGPQITSEGNVGGTPGGIPAQGTPVQAEPGQSFEIRAYANREYVSGGGYFWYANIARALPWNIDDISRDFGDDIYERMLLDAQVRATFNNYKSAVLEDGISVKCAIDDELEDGYEQAKRLTEDVESMLSNLSTPLDDVLWNLLDAAALGNKVAELCFMLDQTFSGKQQFLLDRMVVKPRQSYSFIVDTYMTLLGVLGRIPGQAFGVQQGMLLADVPHTTNLLPPAKFAILTYRPKDNDPRGTSILRPAFDPWNQKQQIKREYLKYLTQFATPSIIGFTAPEADAYAAQNADGTIQTDPVTGDPIIGNPEQDMMNALTKFMNGSVGAFPNGASVTPIEMQGEGEAFQSAFEFYDRQITKTILGQTLATEEGQHQTRAASGTHKDVMDTLVRQGKSPVERMMSLVLKTWLTLNGQKVDPKLMPKLSLGESEQEDLPSLWGAVAQLQQAGYLDKSQYSELDRQVSLPKRDPESLTEEEEPAPPYVVPGTGGVPVPPGTVPAVGTPPPAPASAPPAKPAVKPPAGKGAANGKPAPGQ